jgi:predicted DCC family thiol-disulfide oxidoreductase YuxK
MSQGPQAPIVFYDGDCALCHRAVQFVLSHDRDGVFRYAALQGTTAAAVLPGPHDVAPESMILYDETGIHRRSDAAWRIAARLGGAWPVLGWFRIVPRPIRDRIYDWVARNRYGWFGKVRVCSLPAPEHRHRFLP